MPRVLVPIAEGSEELEAVTIIDLLRRAGIEVVVAGLEDGAVRMSRKTLIMPDTNLTDALREEFDMVVLPGGMPGAEHLDGDARIHGLLQDMSERGKFVCAICAAPMVLANAGVLKGKRATSYPDFLDAEKLPDVTVTNAAVERDGNVITSRGPGTAMDFALELIEALCGAEKRHDVEEPLVRH